MFSMVFHSWHIAPERNLVYNLCFVPEFSVNSNFNKGLAIFLSTNSNAETKWKIIKFMF